MAAYTPSRRGHKARYKGKITALGIEKRVFFNEKIGRE